MIIIGAKGFAKEVLNELLEFETDKEIKFFDNVSDDLEDVLYGKYRVIRGFEGLQGQKFILGIGNPTVRRLLFDKCTDFGLKAESLISKKCSIGKLNVSIGNGVCVMTGSVITTNVKIHDGVLINLNCTIGHDTKIGKFSELCPGVHVSGNVVIGENTFIGTGAVILPNVTLGDNVVIGAGAVVSKSIPSNNIAVGIPARILNKK